MAEWLAKWPKWLYDATTQQFTVVGKLMISIALVVVNYFLIKLLTYLLNRALGINKKGIAIDRSARSFFVQTFRILCWLAVAFLIVQVLGIDVTSFAGILSAITVALGLALQDIISGFASGLILLNQKHFVTGEYISVTTDFGQSCEGDVEKVSLMSTTLKTFDGQYISISNALIRKSIVTNFTRKGTRRIFFTVPVSYEADPELVKKVINDIVKNDKRVLDDPKPYIHYNELGDFSIRVAIKIWTKFNDYWDVYNDLHEKILLEFKKNNIKIPKITNVNIAKEN